jgi:cob(I)alamin adenosyltransferase
MKALSLRGPSGHILPMKIYTRTGDRGDTSLFGAGRVPKDHPRVAAYGDVDELNSVLGMVRATEPNDFFDPLLQFIQRDLFSIGGQLAAPDPTAVAKALAKANLSPDRVSEFERVIDEAERELPALRAFVLPAGSSKAAAFHLARTVCRRAERSVVHLARESEVPELFIVYLNRLSDLLFTLARLANHRAGVSDVTW